MHRVGLAVLGTLLLAYSPKMWAQTDLSGFFEYDNIIYFESPDPSKVNGRNQVILNPKIRHVLGSKADLFGSVELRYDEDDAARNRVFLDEAYANLYAGPVDLRVGLQIYSWGRADGFNPTDFSSRDYSDVIDIDDEKLGLVSLHGTYYTGDWALEVVLMPSFRASVLPGADSRWWPSFPNAIDNPFYPREGPSRVDARYRLIDGVLPDEGLRSFQNAVRATGSARGWDFSLSWFDGFNDLPSLHAIVQIDPALSRVDVLLEPWYHRKRTIGIDFATVVSSAGVHGEAAYNITEDWEGANSEINDPYLHYVLGMDYTIDDLLPDKDLFLLAEWVQEVQIPDRNTVYRFTDLDHLFRKSFFGKADLDLGEFSKVTLEGVYNVATDDWWLQPGVEWSLWDGLELRVDLDLLGGPVDSFLGSVADNHRVQTRLKYSF